MEGMMGKLKLTVNQKKTRTCRVPEESFDFLGYTLGRCYQVGTGKAYIGAKPSKKRVMRLCDKISQMTQHKWCWRETEELVRELNLVLKGWGNYFQLGAVSKAYRAVVATRGIGYANGCAKSTRSRDVGAIDSRMSISTRSSVYSTWNASAQLCRGRKHKQPCPKAEMREIRTSGLMSGIWKRSLRATAPDLDSTVRGLVLFVVLVLIILATSWGGFDVADRGQLETSTDQRARTRTRTIGEASRKRCTA